MELTELRLKGKALGITRAANMKEETLLNRIAYLEREPEIEGDITKIDNPILIETTDRDDLFFSRIGLDIEWLYPIANQYNFNRFQYMSKFKAFRCYRDNKQLDWIDVNDLGLLNGGKELCPILLKHQMLNKKKQVIKLNWRR